MTTNALAHSDRFLHTGGVTGSIPVAPTIKVVIDQLDLHRLFCYGSAVFNAAQQPKHDTSIRAIYSTSVPHGEASDS